LGFVVEVENEVKVGITGGGEIDREKLHFLLIDVVCSLPSEIDEVLNDSAEDPHHSAVHVSNLIKCCIEMWTQLGKELPYYDVKSFILFQGFSEKEYEAFEESRRKESVYYGGRQY